MRRRSGGAQVRARGRGVPRGGDCAAGGGGRRDRRRRRAQLAARGRAAERARAGGGAGERRAVRRRRGEQVRRGHAVRAVPATARRAGGEGVREVQLHCVQRFLAMFGGTFVRLGEQMAEYKGGAFAGFHQSLHEKIYNGVVEQNRMMMRFDAKKEINNQGSVGLFEEIDGYFRGEEFGIGDAEIVERLVNSLLGIWESNEIPDFDLLMEHHIVDFCVWVASERENDGGVVTGAVLLFQCFYFYEQRETILDTLDLMIGLLSEAEGDPELVKEVISAVSIFCVNSKNAYLKIAKNLDAFKRITEYNFFNSELVKNEFLLFSRNLILFSHKCQDKLIPIGFYQYLIEESLKSIERFRPKISKNGLLLLLVLTFNKNTISLEIEGGIESLLLSALNSYSSKYVYLIYSIIFNIFDFCIENNFNTKIISNKIFYTKTAEYIMHFSDDVDTLELILSTIDILGINFWNQFLRNNVFESMISICNKTNFDNSKHICEIFCNLLSSQNLKFKELYGKKELISLLCKMLECEDIVLIENVLKSTFILWNSNPQHFKPIFDSYEYPEILELLCESQISSISQLSSFIYNSYTCS